MYIDDCMNNRYIKYDKDGRYLGEVPRSNFTSREAILPMRIAAGPDCMYLYNLNSDTIYRYRFQDNETIALCLADFGIDWKINELLVLYDGVGNVYLRDRTIRGQNDDPFTQYYKVDPSFTKILEVRKLPATLPLAFYADDEGDLYSIGKEDMDSVDQYLYGIDTSNNVTKVFPIISFKDQFIGLVTEEDIFFAYGEFDLGKCAYITKDGRKAEVVIAKNNLDSSITRNGNIYFRQYRPFSSDDKSPFRIYKLQIEWGQTSQK